MISEEFSRKTLPFLKEEYFNKREDSILYKEIKNFLVKYNSLPNKDSLLVEFENSKSLDQDTYEKLQVSVKEITKETDKNDNLEWLLDKTEKFCQEKAIYNAMMESISIMDGKDKNRTKGSIPNLLQDALSVSFDPHIGHEYLEDSEERYDYYHKVEERFPFDLEIFNKITNGGIPPKTLNIALGGVYAGKTLFMCHTAASYLVQGKNVLYITLEMSEEEISKRIDANLLNISMADLVSIPKDIYEERIGKLKSKTNGRLIVKEYPTATASIIHFSALLNELYLKKNFKPDVIFIDYINIATSSRLKPSTSGLYQYMKSIAEEFRGFAIENNVRLWTATQLNRSGFTSSDPGMENVSESFGTAAVADFLFVLTSNEDLEKMNQIMIKQLKNRYNAASLNKRFMIGIDRMKMRLYNVSESAQEGIVDTGEKDTSSKFKGLKV